MNEPLRTIAGCDSCGRGYVYIHHPGVNCIDNRCVGRVWYLPKAMPIDAQCLQALAGLQSVVDPSEASR